LFEGWAYWAPAESPQTEVDVVLRRGGEHLAIEAKLGQARSSKDLAGLRAIAQLERLVRRVLVCSIDRPRRTEDGIDLLPVARFVEEVQTGSLWP
jgi:hypothetical protein